MAVALVLGQGGEVHMRHMTHRAFLTEEFDFICHEVNLADYDWQSNKKEKKGTENIILEHFYVLEVSMYQIYL